jgi:hypothetical protein
LVWQAVVEFGILPLRGHRQYGKDVSNLFQNQDGSFKIVAFSIFLKPHVCSQVGISDFPFVDEKFRAVLVNGLFQLVPLVKMLHAAMLVKLDSL